MRNICITRARELTKFSINVNERKVKHKIVKMFRHSSLNLTFMCSLLLTLLSTAGSGKQLNLCWDFKLLPPPLGPDTINTFRNTFSRCCNYEINN